MRKSLLFAPLLLCGGCAAMRDVRIAPGAYDSPPPPPVARFSDLHIRLRLLDDRVEVRAGDRTVKGTLVALSAESLVVRVKKRVDVRFACEDIDRVERMGDSVGEGGTVGGLLAVFPAWSGCQVGTTLRQALLCVATGMTIFGGAGALIDMLVNGPRVVYIRQPLSCQPPAPVP